jgi:putative addiction module killer protein
MIHGQGISLTRKKRGAIEGPIRIPLGNFSNVKSVGAGVYECKINFGPGYRVYFGKEGEQMVILLSGGTKQRQQSDIRLALERWEDYKQRKKQQKEKEGE